MKRLIPILAIAAGALLAGGCHFSDHAEARDAGPAVDRTYQVGSFDRIAVAGPYEVTVKTGGQPGVTAHGGEAILAETDIIVENGELKIIPKKKNGMRWNWGKDGKVRVEVSAAGAARGDHRRVGRDPDRPRRRAATSKARWPDRALEQRLQFRPSREARDAGPAVDRTFAVGAFDRIAVSGPYDVIVKTGGQPGVSARGGQAVLDETEVVVEDGVLKIRPSKRKAPLELEQRQPGADDGHCRGDPRRDHRRVGRDRHRPRRGRRRSRAKSPDRATLAIGAIEAGTAEFLRSPGRARCAPAARSPSSTSASPGRATSTCRR